MYQRVGWRAFAAAMVGRVDLIVTKSLKDFPIERLAPFGIEAWHQRVVQNLLGLHKAVARAAAARHRASLRGPPKSVDDYLDTLLVQQLPETVIFLRQHRTRI